MNKSPQLKPLSNPELSAFSSQLSLILRSGISALEGISIMLEDASSEEEKAILNALSENLQETGSLNEALEQTQLFPAYMTRMVRIGEETGTLDDVMAALRGEYGTFKAFKKASVVNALMTAEANGLLEESRFDMDGSNDLRVYYRAHAEGAATINRYIKD